MIANKWGIQPLFLFVFSGHFRGEVEYIVTDVSDALIPVIELEEYKIF